MPLYEYECENCGHRFEKIQKFSDPPLESCPVCGGPVHKLLSSPAIQFKGSGWYITDYARKDKPSTKGEKPETPSSDSKGETKGEAKTEKPETKSETKPATKSDAAGS